jgi:curved DNA-binding protein CbpA
MARKHYDILQIKPGASADEIQHAYRKLAMRYHPDRNPAPDAAAKMADINEAYEILQDPFQRGSADPPIPNTIHADDLTFSILSAARAVILRNGWTVTHEEDSLVLFEAGSQHVRILLTDRLTKDSLLRISRRFREIAAVLAVQIEGPIAVGEKVTVIDLMRAQWHGAPVPEGPCKSLLSGFL